MTTRQAQNRELELAQHGISCATEIHDGKPMRMASVICSTPTCHTKQPRSHSPGAASHHLIKELGQKGWAETKRGWLCPSCSHRQRSLPASPLTPKEKSMPAPNAAAPVAPMPSVQQMVAVADKLEGVFKDGRYESGWSDDRIAEALSIPRVIVAKVRDEHPLFGPLKSNPAIDAIKSDIAAVKTLFAEQIGDLEKRAQRLESENARLGR